MTEKDKIELKNKILRGLEKCYQDLLAYKKRNNEELVILNKNKEIVIIKPQDIPDVTKTTIQDSVQQDL
ncbi:MAG: hypothetical protein LBT27_09320 [Prevotellaceae bacterium]|jgi:hypothetical protein|nr:hypothetical protein [Prevotellaceae bacterium]